MAADQRAGKVARRERRFWFWWEWGEVILVYGFAAVFVTMFAVIFWLAR